MASQLEGVAALSRQLSELADPRKQVEVLRAAVRVPMNRVKKVAEANIAAFSPGAADLHKTYRGRLVSSGFARRSVRVVVKTSRDKQSTKAIIGVLPEAYYALMFFEFGTAYIPRQPWLLPAFDSQKDAMLEGMADTLRKRVEKIAAQRGSR